MIRGRKKDDEVQRDLWFNVFILYICVSSSSKLALERTEKEATMVFGDSTSHAARETFLTIVFS